MLESTIRRIKALQRWDGTTIRILGMIELLLAGALGVNALFALAIGEDASYFSYIFPVVGGLGLFQTLFFSSKNKLSPAVGILLIAVSVLLLFSRRIRNLEGGAELEAGEALHRHRRADGLGDAVKVLLDGQVAIGHVFLLEEADLRAELGGHALLDAGERLLGG